MSPWVDDRASPLYIRANHEYSSGAMAGLRMSWAKIS
jgi:hypothetical protein